MDDDKIVLDRKSFEALAVDTRVKILKSLKERRKTLTEIAKEQKMSVSGIKEHLEILEKTGLIEKIDDGHKWKYYELTKKGKDIVGPKEVKVMILLSTSIVTLILSMLFMIGPLTDSTLLSGQASLQAAEEPETAAAPEAPPDVQEKTDGADAEKNTVGEPESLTYAMQELRVGTTSTETMEPELPVVPIAVAVISLLVMLGCIAILIRHRMQ